MPTFTIESRKLLLRGVFAVNKIKYVTSVEVLETVKGILLKVGISTLFCSVARRRSETIFTLSKMSFIINSWTVGCVDGFGKTASWNEAYSTEKSAVLWDVTPCGIWPRVHPKALKVGHGGTLDNTATGILVVGVGFGCKILSKLLHGNKKYRVTGRLGIATDTYNETGNITRECSFSHISRQMLEEALYRFHGEILQTPPLYSALKLHGHRVADLTRAGVSVEMRPRPVTCHAIRCLEFSPPFFTLEVHCGGGFYVRSLVHDLGNVLGSCAYVTELHRFQQDPFMEQDMLDSNDWTMQNILTAIQKAEEIHGEILKCCKK